MTEDYLDSKGNKINCLKLGSTKPQKTLEDGYVIVKKKQLYLTSNREILVVSLTNTITPIDNIVVLQDETPYRKFVVNYSIEQNESFIKYDKFDFNKYELLNNPIDSIIENLDKKINRLQKRIDRLNTIKEIYR